jgi:hypothetical protein
VKVGTNFVDKDRGVCLFVLYFVFRNYLTAAVFAKLQHGDPYGRISIMALFNYIMRKVWYHQTRIGLSLYDVVGQGYLREVVSYDEIWTERDLALFLVQMVNCSCRLKY